MLFSLQNTPATMPFPEPEMAEQEPNGLLAIGGDLSTVRLLNAYKHGIFPWYNDGEPILWWSPSPRLVLYPEQFNCRKSLRRRIKNGGFQLKINTSFQQVISACAAPRTQQENTWILDEMKQAYQQLHQAGFAHSIEIWKDEQLVGGFYGINIGHVFFGESMFSTMPDASKIALYSACQLFLQWNISLIDCQVYSEHLASLGAIEIDRKVFIDELGVLEVKPSKPAQWQHFSTTAVADFL